MQKVLTLFFGASWLLSAGLTSPAPPTPPARAAQSGWQPQFATAGLDGMVRQVLVQPDGSAIAAGAFTFAGPGGRLAHTLARWDGITWQPLGNEPLLGPEGYVVALARTPKGELLAAGRPRGYYATHPAEVLRYDGTHWQRLGQPAQTANVWTLAVLPTGEIVAGSGPTGQHPGAYGGGLLRWTGRTWQPYAPAPAGTELCQVLVTRKGELVAAGYFRDAATAPARPAVARWTGQRWQRLGTAFSAAVLTLAETPSGSLLAGGEFTDAGGAADADHVARWDGTAWRAMSTDFNGPIRRLLVGPGGEVVANGEFSQASGSLGYCIARWQDQRWVPLTPRNDGYCKQVLAVLPGGSLLGANNYGGPGPGGYYKDLMRYQMPATSPAAPAGTEVIQRYIPWLPLTSPHTQGLSSDCNLTALAATATGELAISGYMQLPGTGSWQYTVALYNGNTWLQLRGFDGRHVLALAFQPGGELVAGGLFPTEKSGGLALDDPAGTAAGRCRYVARWDGYQWQPLGDGPPGPVLTLTHTPTGQLLAGGAFGVARWDGATWKALQSPAAPAASTAEVPAGQVAATALAVTPGGDIYAANALANRRNAGPATYLARWDGTTWQPVGEGLNGPVTSLAVAPNGDLLASGSFGPEDAPRNACSVARWDGRAWQYLGPPLPQAACLMTVLASGTVVLAGHFALPGSPRLVNLARWTGTAWEPLAGGLNDYAQQLVAVPGGGLAVAGRFTATADSTQSLGHVGVYHER